MIPLKNVRMLIVGLLVGVILATCVPVFGEGTSKISAYLREGFTFKVKGKTTELQNTPIVYQDTTYLPVRELASMLGYEVGFADNTISLDQKAKDVANVTTTTTIDTTIQLSNTEWIDLIALSEKCSVLYGPSTVTLQNGETKVKFDLPTNVKGETSVTTDNGLLKVYVLNGAYYLYINDLKTIGLIQ